MAWAGTSLAGRIYAASVVLPGEFVAQLRSEVGLSQRALARRAGCTRSTIVRIEAGEMDPTFTMLARITGAAGQRLTISRAHLGDDLTLASFAGLTPDAERMDWTLLRGLIDLLRAHPERVSAAISDPPARTGDLRVDNLLAAVADKLAEDAFLARPRWIDAVPRLEGAWRAPGTPRMKAREAATAPPQFVRRNILLGKGNLWRER